MAESKGFFGVLPYAFASLRSLTTDFQTVHRTVFIGEADRPCSNPLLKITQRKTRHSKSYTLFSWRRARDSNPRNRFGGLHDFQSCSFDQLGQLSVSAIKCSYIIYDRAAKIKSFFKNPELFIFALPAYRINRGLRGINIICKSANFTCFLLYCIEPGDEI